MSRAIEILHPSRQGRDCLASSIFYFYFTKLSILQYIYKAEVFCFRERYQAESYFFADIQ